MRSGAVLFAKDVARLPSFYARVLELQVAERGDDYVTFEAPGIQRVIHAVLPEEASTIEITVPPVPRASAAIKPVFFVRSIDRVRAVAESLGGVVNSAEQEWLFRGTTVCDGLDPEGNVIQFREPAGERER